MSQQALVVVFLIVVLVGIGFALTREFKLLPKSKGVGSNASALAVRALAASSVAAENAPAVVTPKKEEKKFFLRPKPGHVIILGKHGRGKREVPIVRMGTLRGMPAVRVRFPGDPTVHRRSLSQVIA